MVEISRAQDSRVESSMSHFINEADLTGIAGSVSADANEKRDRKKEAKFGREDPLKRLKSSVM